MGQQATRTDSLSYSHNGREICIYQYKNKGDTIWSECQEIFSVEIFRAMWAGMEGEFLFELLGITIWPIKEYVLLITSN